MPHLTRKQKFDCVLVLFKDRMVHELSEIAFLITIKDFLLKENIKPHKTEYSVLGGSIMFFHYVKPGDSLSEITRRYNVSKESIIRVNSLIEPDDLVVNQCLLIPDRSEIHTVRPGDTLSSIALRYGTTVDALIRRNPGLQTMIYPNQEILLPSDQKEKKTRLFNGYCYEGSNRENIKKALPYLTFLSVFAYRVDEEGNLSSVDDEDFVRLAKENDVRPIMVITNTKAKGGFSPDIAHAVISDREKSSRLFQSIERTLKEKGYYGLNIDFEYVSPSDKEAFLEFIASADRYFHHLGYYLSISLAPKYRDDQKGLLYESHDYEKLSEHVDHVILMTYEWGYTYGPAMAVAPYNEVKKVLDYAITRIPRSKIVMGIPNYGYDFIIPYKEKQKAQSITNPQAIPLAFRNHAEILRSKTSRTPYFRYKKDEIMHEVHFDDPCSIEEKLSLLDDLNIAGGSIWTVSSYTAYYYALMENGFYIKKV